MTVALIVEPCLPSCSQEMTGCTNEGPEQFSRHLEERDGVGQSVRPRSVAERMRRGKIR